ncbi:MAG: SMP-30/gluconolactonase/LRE family protein [Planctomycetota bacterium]
MKQKGILVLSLWIVIAIVSVVMLTGCGANTALKNPTIAVTLPEKYNTPDGMALDKNNNILLCVPNFNNDSYPSKIIKIHPDDQISEVFTFPKHPETGKYVGALGIDIGRDGNYYVADNQSFTTNEHKSRLVRINIRNGKAVGFDVLVTGFVQSNAISCYGDSVYVTETAIDTEATPMPSGVYRFRYSEFSGEPIRLLPGGTDRHLVTTFLTDNPDWRVGANGMGFDSKGNLFVCNFGEQSVIKIKLDYSGNVTSQGIFAQGNGMESTDGIKIDPKTDDIYVADFVGNAVHKIDAKTGKITTIAKNENNSGGVGGKLDRPSEVCLRDNKIYVANIDLPFGGNEYDEPHTISVIELDK